MRADAAVARAACSGASPARDRGRHLTIIASQGGFAPDAAPVHVVVAADSPFNRTVKGQGVRGITHRSVQDCQEDHPGHPAPHAFSWQPAVGVCPYTLSDEERAAGMRSSDSSPCPPDCCPPEPTAAQDSDR